MSHQPQTVHKEALSSYDGFTTRIQARVTIRNAFLGFVLKGGEASGYQALNDLVRLSVVSPTCTSADKRCDDDNVHNGLLMKGILPVLPRKVNRKELVASNFHVYGNRIRIERIFKRLEHSCCIATCCDKTAILILAFLNLSRGCI